MKWLALLTLVVAACAGRAAPAVVIPELPKQVRAPQAAALVVSEALVWVVPTGTAFRVVQANMTRPVGAKLMRLVAEERDDDALRMLRTLRAPLPR